MKNAWVLVFAGSLFVPAAFVACSDSSNTTATDAGFDSTTIPPTTDGATTDTSTPDTAPPPDDTGVPDTGTDAGPKTVYSVGSWTDDSDYTTACYWAGTTRHDLPETTGADAAAGIHGAEGYSIFVSGGVVYVGGYRWSSSGVQLPVYWAGVTEHDLPAVADQDAVVNGIFVSGGKVYAGGFHKDAGGSRIPTYWVDGTRHDIPPSLYTGEAEILNIFVVGTKVYAVGQHDIYNATGGPFARYWVSDSTGDGGTDTKVDILPADGGDSAEANGIFVSGTTVFNSGSWTGPAGVTPAYWVDGGVTNLGSAFSVESTARNIFAASGTVYTAGFWNDVDSGGFNVPAYWNGTTRTDLSKPFSNHDGVANDIIVSGGKVYTTGYWYDDRPVANPCYWEGTTRHDLSTGRPDGGGRDSKAFMLVVE